MRIGLISDTHIPMNATELPAQLAEVFDGVELILHGGDIYLISVLDELGKLAPVLAAYGDGDARLGLRRNADQRIKESHVMTIEGVRLGLIHTLRYRGSSIARAFDGPVDIAICGHTHEASVERSDGITVVNPGSATLPQHQLNRPGTVGLLEIADGEVDVRIVQLS